ncbi:methyltransferase-like protein 27 [Micropterus salmoides]|uniref:methyltransferase-like protein 27 n=1 Tax=Micropterus salmoides TaxID=27706 RepID=UPI0018EB2ED0|nr:methyltransferase-like protein 27 [Micropterus salmoides]XP_038568336.1 methyltransferase-like protein 27 [Micropterus salmoides]
MADSCRTADDARVAFQSCKSPDPEHRVQFYDTWTENYEKDHSLMSYRAPYLAVDALSENFSGSPGEALVLDVACGSGWVAKVMVELGFRHFVGVDGSNGMLELAAKTGLYQDLRLALLGPQPLPAQTGVFDVVIIVGALDAGFVPVSVVRELCRAAKPGGLVCMARGDHTGGPAQRYKQDLERELQLMQEEGLWSLVGLKQTDRYMENPHLNPERDRKQLQEERFISGTVYLYEKSIDPSKSTNQK